MGNNEQGTIYRDAGLFVGYHSSQLPLGLVCVERRIRAKAGIGGCYPTCMLTHRFASLHRRFAF